MTLAKNPVFLAYAHLDQLYFTCKGGPDTVGRTPNPAHEKYAPEKNKTEQRRTESGQHTN
jgi:hypothetical protein